VRGLEKAADIQIDVVHRPVHQPQFVYVFLGKKVFKVGPGLGRARTRVAYLSVGIVTRQSVVPASLNVQGDDVQAAKGVFALEQVVLDRGGKRVVPALGRDSPIFKNYS
jgi:hypothetical protein